MAEDRDLATMTCDYPLGPLGEYVAEEITKLIKLLQERGLTPRTNDILEGGVKFENDVFAMRPDTMDCSCGAIEDPETDHHSTGCPILAPNFRCGNLVIGWEGKIGLGMSTNRREVNGQEFRDVFERCRESLEQ